jgi:rRNA maturation RNase YbeY
MARKMLAALGFRRAELSVVFLSGPAMRRLNRKALGHDHVTDVLTFDLTGAGCSSSVKMLEAEIYICPDEARRNARAYGEPFSAEIIRYVAHGLLHLCGFRDRSPSQQARMRRHEEALISAVDLPSFLSRMKSKKVLL